MGQIAVPHVHGPDNDEIGTAARTLGPPFPAGLGPADPRHRTDPSAKMKQVYVMSSLSIVADDAGRYVHWGVIQISVTNLVIIAAMVVVFALAILVPFGSRQDRKANDERPKR